MSASSKALADHPKRKMPRHETDAVTCDLGEILDLSGSGMRVAFKRRCPLKVGEKKSVKLRTPSGTATVMLRTVWRRRTGWLGGYQAGFQFDGISPKQSVALATLARFGFVSAADVQPVTKKRAASTTRSSPGNVAADIVMAEYYDRLDVARDASMAEIKDAYRKLARKYHPDVAPGEENRQKFIALREAYDLLCDHMKRAG